MHHRPSALLVLTISLSACDPYAQRPGEYSAGPVDPIGYPAAYLGVGGDGSRSGTGTFTAAAAYAGGAQVGYFAFPISAAQLKAAKSKKDPLQLVAGGKAVAAAPTPKAYVFDRSAASPFPAVAACKPPAGYSYDPQRDEVKGDEQGNLFTALPASGYVPLVAEVPVTSHDELCQSIKTAATVLVRGDVSVGMPDGKFLAWALIDPAAAVYRVGQTASTSSGVGLQHFGWFNHYLVAYLDGGDVPTKLEADKNNKPTVTMLTQQLYYPRSMVQTGSSAVPGTRGAGYDVLEFARGQDGYSPVCALFTYDAGKSALPAEQLPRDAAAVLAQYKATLQPADPPYVYCLQVEGP